jgi:hypothetical protein
LGSKLREIAPGAFSDYVCLKRICIPVSVEKMNPTSFPQTEHPWMEMETENPYFDKKGDFLS